MIILNKQTREGVKKYKEKVFSLLDSGIVDISSREDIKEIISGYSLDKKTLKKTNKQACKHFYKEIIKNLTISEKEKDLMIKLSEDLDIDKKDYGFDQNEFNKYYIIGKLAADGPIPIENFDHDIRLKDDEVLWWACSASYNKIKRVTNRVSYAGPRFNFRIAKGISYRVGSYKFQTSSSEHLIPQDTGLFWVTNKRIGFLGARKHFDFPHSKLAYFDLNANEGMKLFKEGRENPFMLTLDDFDLPVKFMEYILNGYRLVVDSSDDIENRVEPSDEDAIEGKEQPNKNDTEKSSNKNKDSVYGFFSWFWFVVFFMLGMGAFLSFDFVMGIATFFVSFILYPKTKKKLYEKYNFELSNKIKYLVVFLYFVFMTVFID